LEPGKKSIALLDVGSQRLKHRVMQRYQSGFSEFCLPYREHALLPVYVFDAKVADLTETHAGRDQESEEAVPRPTGVSLPARIWRPTRRMITLNRS
jgi:hypothetical protein